MDLGDVFQNAFDYAKMMAKDAGRWIVLIILGVIPIVNLVVFGYGARVVKETPGSSSPPALERYMDLWVKGLMVVIVYVIYALIPLILLGLGIGSLVAGIVVFPLALVGAVVFIVAGIVLAFLVAIISSMGIVHMIKNDQFGKAFAFKEITEIIRKIGWGRYLLWLVAVFVIGLIFGALGNIPYIGWLITVILIPPYTVFIARSAGLIYEGELPSPKAGELKYCIQCGAALPGEADFCAKCGTKQ